MSGIGPGLVAGYQIAGSIVGTRHNGAHLDEQLGQLAAGQRQVDLQAHSGLDADVGRTELSADRDADGRLLGAPLSAPEDAQKEPIASEQALLAPSPRSRDEERGRILDLDA